MHNKILLAAAISWAALPAGAVPFAPTDARAMAMGGTGVASAKTVHAVQFNPALLSSADESDDFGMLFPQMGGYFSDENDFIESADDFVEADFITSFNAAIDNISSPIDNIQTLITTIDSASSGNGNLAALSSATTQLATETTSLVTGSTQLSTATSDLTTGEFGLQSLSGKALRGGLGGGAGVAIPSKKFSFAISANNSTSFAGQLNVATSDLNTINAYPGALAAFAGVTNDYATAAAAVSGILTRIETAQATNDLAAIPGLGGELSTAQADLTTASSALNNFSYGGTSTPDDDSDGDFVIFEGGALASGAQDITLDSTVDIIAIAVTEIAISISREFTFGDRQVAIGITPKLQRIDAYDYTVKVEDETDTGDITDSGVDDTAFNLDIGASTRFGSIEQGTIGIVAKNLIGRDITTVNGRLIEIKPQLRAGVSYQAFGWINLAADLDLMENDPVAFEEPSQYFAAGLEADVFGFMQLRGGFRTNLAASDQEVISLGAGLSPFSLFHTDIGLYTNTSDPKKEVGLVFEFGVDW
ncbi:MAG: conjugal transfer protein TraF [Bermanella sp.]